MKRLGMNPRVHLLLVVLCSVFTVNTGAQIPVSVRLSGVWAGREQDGADAGELTFSQGDKLAYSFGEVLFAGRYEIDSSKSPTLLVFHVDSAPGQKVYSTVEIISDKEIRLSHFCDGTPESLAKQPIVTFLRK